MTAIQQEEKCVSWGDSSKKRRVRIDRVYVSNALACCAIMIFRPKLRFKCENRNKVESKLCCFPLMQDAIMIFMSCCLSMYKHLVQSTEITDSTQKGAFLHSLKSKAFSLTCCSKSVCLPPLHHTCKQLISVWW